MLQNRTGGDTMEALTYKKEFMICKECWYFSGENPPAIFNGIQKKNFCFKQKESKKGTDTCPDWK